MTNITLTKTKYQQLTRQAEAYRKFTSVLFQSLIQDPVSGVVKSFRETNLYTKSFLKDLESGLRKSSYVKKYASKNSTSRS